MPKLQANGIEFHYVQRGEGPDIVLIHGVTSSLAMWYNGVLPALTPSYRVTAFDLRGHGLTTLTEHGYSSADMAKDLIAVLDGLGIDKTVVVGHSFGGVIGLHGALQRPDRIRGVAMLDSGLACLRYLRIIEDWSGWEKRPEVLKERGFTLERFLELDSKQDVTDILLHGAAAPRMGGFRKGQDGLTPRVKRLLTETKIGFEFRDVAGLTEDRLKEIQTPVLAIYGETSPYQKMALRLNELIPNCRHQVIHGAGHFYAVLRPEIMMGFLTEFAQNPQAFVEAETLAPDQA
jgi:pimeloyl-ACP methyl ester carboxylesterase